LVAGYFSHFIFSHKISLEGEFIDNVAKITSPASVSLGPILKQLLCSSLQAIHTVRTHYAFLAVVCRGPVHDGLPLGLLQLVGSSKIHVKTGSGYRLWFITSPE